jgi:hypothetical protein
LHEPVGTLRIGLSMRRTPVPDGRFLPDTEVVMEAVNGAVLAPVSVWGPHHRPDQLAGGILLAISECSEVFDLPC